MLVNVSLGDASEERKARSAKGKDRAETVLDAEAEARKDTLLILGATANDTKCWMLKGDKWGFRKDFVMPVHDLKSFGAHKTKMYLLLVVEFIMRPRMRAGKFPFPG